MAAPDSVPPPSQAEDRVPCRICLEPIRRGAIKCTKCDGYQDWHRLFSMNTVVLTLLVALISVISSAAPVVRDIVVPHRSKVLVSVLDSNPRSINVVASNVGNRPAILKTATLTVLNGPTRTTLSLVWDRTVTGPVLEPATVKLIEFWPESNRARAAPPRGDPGCLYRVAVDLIAFDHKPVTAYATSPCLP